MVNDLINQRRAFNVELLPPASSAELLAMEAVLECPLPPEARAIFARANGMADYAYDRWFVSFWSSTRFLAEHEAREGVDDRGAFREVSFADVSISAWDFYYRVRPDGVISVLVEATGEEIPSFAAFLTRYVQDPESLGLIDVSI